MATHVHLVAKDGQPMAVFHDVSKAVAKVGVVIYRGDYFTFTRYEAVNTEIHVFFSVTDIMEINV